VNMERLLLEFLDFNEHRSHSWCGAATYSIIAATTLSRTKTYECQQLTGLRLA
jgi:hypothetical protein